MALLGVTQTRQISASVRLSESTAIQVDQYAAFIRANADDVIEQSLIYVFAKGRDFQEFLKRPEAKKVATSLRIHKAPAPEPVGSQQRRPVAAPETGDEVRGSRA
jgi:hypothetical protein